MKIKSSLKSLKKRDLNSKLVRRRGRVYIINKTNPKFKARQKQFFYFMIIGSISENKEIEKRISITPDLVKNFTFINQYWNWKRRYDQRYYKSFFENSVT